MRFKANIINSRSFSQLITSLSPIAKRGMLRLRTDKCQVICREALEGVKIWATIETAQIFDPETLKIEARDENEIVLELSIESLAKAMRSAIGSTDVIIKLAKSGSGASSVPVLVVVIHSQSAGGREQVITHEVSARVLTPKEKGSAVEEPLCPQPNVAVTLPSLEILAKVADRLKTMSPYVKLSANGRGEMRLRIETDEANVQTEWRNLRNPFDTSDGTSQTDPNTLYSVTIDSSTFNRFCKAYRFASATVACICEDHGAILYVYIGDPTDGEDSGVLIFLVPAINIEGDDE